MVKIYTGTSYDGKPTGELKEGRVNSFEGFCKKFLDTCRKGKKCEDYFVIGDCYDITKGDSRAHPLSYLFKDHFHRNNRSQVTAWLLPFDGDNSKNHKNGCIDPKIVHDALVKLKYNHFIYTTYSHKKGFYRWRLILPCQMTHLDQLKPTVNSLYTVLTGNGCGNLALSNESKTWAVPWFFPTREDPEDGLFECYGYFEGRDFFPVNSTELDAINVVSSVHSEGTKTINHMVGTIVNGMADTGLHECTRNLSHMLINDGLAPATVKALIYGLTATYSESDPRQLENRTKIEPLVDSAYKKLCEENVQEEWLEKEHRKFEDIYTNYPHQGGTMEELVNFCMRWMLFPNRPLAVVACHALLAGIGGRTYTLEGSGSGITLQAQVTGRSAIGKESVKDFIIFMLNNCGLNKYSPNFVGSAYRTSVKNVIRDLEVSGSCVCIDTESGLSGQSKAGDMHRVNMLEHSFATNSGINGSFVGGGQNEEIKAIYSPALSIVQESVPQTQKIANNEKLSMVTGKHGRQNHIIAPEIKPYRNQDRLTEIPKKLKKLINKMCNIALDPVRKELHEPLHESKWIIIKYADFEYLQSRYNYWVDKENEGVKNQDPFTYTYYGRLHEKVPAFAGRLAIADNYKNPIITNEHIDLAEKSLEAEIKTYVKQEKSGRFDDDWSVLVETIKEHFMGDMVEKSNKTIARTGKKLLKEGCCEIRYIFLSIKGKCEAYNRLKTQNNFNMFLEQRLKVEGINKVPVDIGKKKFGKGGVIYKRGTLW